MEGATEIDKWYLEIYHQMHRKLLCISMFSWSRFYDCPVGGRQVHCICRAVDIGGSCVLVRTRDMWSLLDRSPA